jgi:hypothetical protein
MHTAVGCTKTFKKRNSYIFLLHFYLLGQLGERERLEKKRRFLPCSINCGLACTFLTRSAVNGAPDEMRHTSKLPCLCLFVVVFIHFLQAPFNMESLTPNAAEMSHNNR